MVSCQPLNIMPSFKIFRSFGGSKSSPRLTPIIAKDFAYDTATTLSSVNTMTHPRPTSIPPEIIKSQPITDPSHGRRGTLKKRNKVRCFQALFELSRINHSSILIAPSSCLRRHSHGPHGIAVRVEIPSSRRCTPWPSPNCRSPIFRV